MVVLILVSSTKTGRSGSSRAWIVFRRTRFRATAGRGCSSARSSRGSRRPRLPIALHPLRQRGRANAKAFRRRADRLAPQMSPDNPFTTLLRMRFRHPCRPPSPLPSSNRKNTKRGIPPGSFKIGPALVRFREGQKGDNLAHEVRVPALVSTVVVVTQATEGLAVRKDV